MCLCRKREAPDPATLASAPPIHMSSTFVSEDVSGFSAHDLTPESPYAYSRWANPTVAMLEPVAVHPPGQRSKWPTLPASFVSQKML